MTKTATLTEPDVAGVWDVEVLPDGSLLLSPRVGPGVSGLEAMYAQHVNGDEFEIRWSELPPDREG
jgi:hypothetical protein